MVTAAVLVVRPWAGHRVGATVVLPVDKAQLFAATGAVRQLGPAAGIGPEAGQAPATPAGAARLPVQVDAADGSPAGASGPSAHPARAGRARR